MSTIVGSNRRLPWLPLSLAVLTILPACGGPPPTQDWPEATEQTDEQKKLAVLETHKELVRAFEVRNTTLFASLLAPTSELEIFHPLLKNRFTSIDEVKRALPRMFRRLGDAKWTTVDPVVTVRGNVAWLTAQMMVDSSLMPIPFVGRGTEIWVRMNGTWLLVHGHWSENPEMELDFIK